MRYAVRFTKTGYMKYISHLDMMRLFERLFKRTGIDLKYSNGFNPHPKISFANPLSLGYESIGEILEFETVDLYRPDELKKMMNSGLAEGIEVTAARDDVEGKSLASRCISADYLIYVPYSGVIKDDICEAYLSQREIIAYKKKKKTKELVETDIKGRILDLKIEQIDDNIIMTLKCDLRNDSSLSPELVIQSFLKFTDIGVERNDIEVVRTNIEIDDFSF